MTIIRKASKSDYEQIWNIFSEVIKTGDTYVFYPNTPKTELDKHWFAAAPSSLQSAKRCIRITHSKAQTKYITAMKYIIPLLILFPNLAFAQSGLPDFLAGTWKIENKDIYEHWDRLDENALKGLSYKIMNGQLAISEYLDISRSENGITYTATVLNQNQGKGIHFKLTQTDSVYTFQNPNHDFPKKIVYQKLNPNEIFVQVSDGKQKGFAYRMVKQIEEPTEKDVAVSNPNYDASLARKLGADDYGMKSYILVMLKTGNNQTADKTLISNSFKGHLENMNRLVEQEKLIVAGPFGKNDNSYRGIFILDVTTFEEAEELMLTDPAIKNELLAAELYKWYGSAALPEYLGSADRIWKVNP